MAPFRSIRSIRNPNRFLPDPLHPPASASKLATTGVNHDTLLVVGWLDLSSRPQVLHVPDFSGRYYSVQFTGPFNIDLAYVGTRETGAHRRATISLRRARLEEGKLPNGMKQVSLQNNSVLVVGRILRLQRWRSLEPLMILRSRFSSRRFQPDNAETNAGSPTNDRLFRRHYTSLSAGVRAMFQI